MASRPPFPLARPLLASALLTLTLVAGAPVSVAPRASTAQVAVSDSLPTHAPAAAGATGYVAPVPAPLRVIRPFDPPSGPYGPGHRGVDLAVASRQVIRAPAAGVVTFAGQVAGRGVVVVMHPDATSTEYEPVAALVRVGTPVRQGDRIARLVGTDAGCGWPNCLHWGARRAGVYLDPLLLLLQPLGPVRLLPWSGGG